MSMKVRSEEEISMLLERNKAENYKKALKYAVAKEIKELKYLMQFLELTDTEYSIIENREVIQYSYCNRTNIQKHIRIPILDIDYLILKEDVLYYDIRDIIIDILKAKENAI